MANQERYLRTPECTDRIWNKALPEVIPDGLRRRLDRWLEERRNLCAVWMEVEGRSIGGMGASLPS